MSWSIRFAIACCTVNVVLLSAGCGSTAEPSAPEPNGEVTPIPAETNSVSPQGATVTCNYVCPTNPNIEFFCNCGAICFNQCKAACGGVSCHDVP